MAKEYLDKSGLSYFWGKIKAYFMRRNLAPEQSKTYTGVIASANSDPAGFLYFGSLKPVDYHTPWRIRYRMYVTIGGLSSRHKSYFDVEMRGMASTYWGWDNYNQVDTSYRPLYYHVLYTCTSAGITNGYGHLLGVRLQSSYNPATAANARTFDIRIVETENCTFTFFDTMTLYANVPGTGSTNYSARSQFDGANYGHKMAGDSNSQGQYIYHYNNVKAKAAITNPSLIVGDINGYCRVGSGVTFDISYPILWCTAALAVNAQNYANVFTRNYDLNIASGAKSGFTSSANKMIYLVVTISGLTATIDSSIITDTLPSSDDGKVYILIGHMGTNSTGANYFILYEVHPMFVYKNGAIQEYVRDALTVSGHTVAKDVPSNAVFTDTTYSEATTSAAGLMSASDKTKLNGIATGAVGAELGMTGTAYLKSANGSDVASFQNGAEVNQNAFSNIKVGSTTIVADDKADTLELESSSGIDITPDATNDKVTIGINGSYIDSAFSVRSGAANGICPLDANSKVDSAYLPSGASIGSDTFLRKRLSKTGLSASTYYVSHTFSMALTGYTPVSMTMSCNQAACVPASVNIATGQVTYMHRNASSISGLNIYADVLYIKNEYVTATT